MFSTLDVDIRPGSGLGMFEIGVSLWNVLDLLRNMPHFFPQVDVKFDPDSPTTPIVLHIRPHIDLLFSGYHQRLHTICVGKLRDLNPPLSLTYKQTILSSSDEVLRRIGVSRIFGPTYAGDDLKYPGVSFSFEDDGRADGMTAPSPHPDDRVQEVRKVIISQKIAEGEVRDTMGEVTECPSMAGEISNAIIKVHDGIRLHFFGANSGSIPIKLGLTTAQDLTCELGPPLRIHHKEDDRMTIHSRSTLTEESGSDYFYNYLQHGIDFLLSGVNHTVKKIVLHTNMPGTPMFQQYKRCPWEIEGAPEDDEDESPPRKRFYDRVEEIGHFLAPGLSPPSMILDRTDEEEGLQLPNPTTRLFGYDGIVLEATESAQVVTAMLF